MVTQQNIDSLQNREYALLNMTPLSSCMPSDIGCRGLFMVFQILPSSTSPGTLHRQCLSADFAFWGAYMGPFFTMSNNQEARSSDTLNPSWSRAIKHYIDESSPPVSKKVRRSDTVSQSPAKTYNGVPRELLRKSQTLLANEIRLLDLAPGTHGDPLAGSLRKVRLSDAIVYEPLSYTWKDYELASNNEAENDTCPGIFLENIGSFISIGTNCEKALCSVRRATAERTIWVDSICVNQDDPEERSRQVDLMQTIFAKAFTVMVYLGQESREQKSSLAMSLLGQPDRLRHVDGLDQNETRSLKHLFERPYFRRMWIVQEVALAQTLELHCGPASTYLSAFAEKPLEAILGAEIAHPPWLTHSKHAAISLRKPRTVSRTRHLLRLIFDTASCECKDDRDRIFALFSLLDDSDHKRFTRWQQSFNTPWRKGLDHNEWLKADYTKTTVQVYTEIATYVAMDGLACAVLMLSQRLALGCYSGLPSWVPNWKALGTVGVEAGKLWEDIILRSQSLEALAKIRVSTSGVMTIRGKLLGPIIFSRYGKSLTFEQRDRMRQNQNRSFVSIWELGESTELQGKESIWTLTKPTQFPAQESWECRLEFVSCHEPPSNTQHIAIVLHDWSTILILRLVDDHSGNYTLAEIGKPRVWGVVPEAWAWDDHQRCTEISLQALDRELFDSWFPHIRAENLSCLSQYPELWSYNPAISATSLTYRALEQARCTDLTALSLWLEWQKRARSGFQILGNKTSLQLLINEVEGLKQEDYKQIELNAGMGQSWSLSHFLGLFIKDPLNIEAMEWPELHINDDRTSEETTAMLPLLMQWAEVTYRFLRRFQPRVNYRNPWLNTGPFKIEDLYSDAMATACFHLSLAAVISEAHDPSACNSGRASSLLRKIFRQSSESPDLESEQERSTRFENGRYWDWKKFDFVVEERLSFLRHVRRDVKYVQKYFHDDPLNFRYAAAHQVLAAHGVDLTRVDPIEIQIG